MRRITKILTASILAVSLFSGSVLSAFPAVAVEKTYTIKDLFSKILQDNATMISTVWTLIYKPVC